jgi:hypothetical protein
MRDVGTLVWVALLVIGVISSMVSSARRQVAAAKAPRRPGPPSPAATPQQRLMQALQARVQATAAPPRAPQPRPAPPRPVSAPRSEPPTAPTVYRPRRRALFETGPDLVRAVIAAEVLGKPRGLHDEYR